MEAIREGEFDTDMDTSESDEETEPINKAAPMTRAKQARITKQRKRRVSKPKKTRDVDDSDSDYVQAAEEEEEEEELGQDLELDDQAEGDEQLGMAKGSTEHQLVEDERRERRRKKKEQRLTIKFKVANLMKAGVDSSGANRGSKDDELRLEDIDWSDIDIETINEILARREELRKKRRRESSSGMADDGEITTAKLKKSSLAPAPLHLERVKRNMEPSNADESAEPSTAQESAGKPQPHSLDDTGLLVAKTLAATVNAAAVKPSSISTSAGAEAMDSGVAKDMRIVLQYELRREESLLKDLHAEIVDKLFKLQTEEKLLRLIVKDDFHLPEEDSAMLDEPTAHVMEASVFGPFADVDGHQFQGSMDAGEDMPSIGVGIGTDAVDAGEESDGSLSGMSSSSSEDEVQDDEIARGALSRMLTQYLPNGGE
ncbi:hypothetical protein GGI12_004089 [Dipsacomyces acuminosporus]|nr:hypothetical protein GGI12_004089 [Dipsacomyces acuminosporus]